MRGDRTVHVPQHAVADYSRRGMHSSPRDLVLGRQTIAFWDFPKPLIAAVNGLAVGGGANIALANHADLVICSTNASFKWPFSTLGLTPELGSSLVLPYLVGMARAKELMFRGEWLSATDAVTMGLANEVVEPDELMLRAVEVATDLTTRQQPALQLAKKVINHHLRKDLEEVLGLELETITESIKATGGLKIRKTARGGPDVTQRGTQPAKL